MKRGQQRRKLFPQPKISLTNCNLCLQGEINPLHPYSRRKHCLEYVIVARSPRFCLCPFCCVSMDGIPLDMMFWIFDQQDQLPEQNQTFVLLSIPMIELESWKNNFLTNCQGKENNWGIQGINQLSRTFTLWLHLFPSIIKHIFSCCANNYVDRELALFLLLFLLLHFLLQLFNFSLL